MGVREEIEKKEKTVGEEKGGGQRESVMNSDKEMKILRP